MEAALLSDWSTKLVLLPPPNTVGLPDLSISSLLAAHTQYPPVPSPRQTAASPAAQSEEQCEAEQSIEQNESDALLVWKPQLAAHLCWKTLQDTALQEINPFYSLAAHQGETCSQCCRFAALHHHYQRELRRHQNHQDFVKDRQLLADLADQTCRLWTVRVGQAASSPPSPPPVWTWFSFRHTTELHSTTKRRRQQRRRAAQSAASWQQLPVLSWTNDEGNKQ